jgi:hypothetical protein
MLSRFLYVVLTILVAAYISSPGGAKATTKTQGDFNLSNRFSLEIVEYQDGDDLTTRFRPGMHKPGKIKVTKDWTDDTFSKWYESRKRTTHTCSIDYTTPKGHPRRINLYDCRPVSWSHLSPIAGRVGPSGLEVIELSYARLDLK